MLSDPVDHLGDFAIPRLLPSPRTFQALSTGKYYYTLVTYTVEIRAIEARGCVCFSFDSCESCVKSLVKCNTAQGLTGSDASGPT